VARVRLTAFPPPAYVKGCEEIYRVGSDPRAYVQRFDCTYYFGEHADDYFDGRATVHVDDANRHDITVFGCGLCGAKGGRIPMHGGIGWDLRSGDSRTVIVQLDGRRLQCRPPTGADATAYTALHGPDLYYDITKDGRCVVIN